MMVDLLILPNELLIQILRFVLPADLENVAQISRHVYQVTTPLLEEHRKLIRTYSTFSNQPYPDDTVKLLNKIIEQPRIGHYIRRAVLDYQAYRLFSLLSVADIEHFAFSASQSDWLPNPIKLYHYNRKRILEQPEYAEDFAIAMLFLLTPNLTKLSLKHYRSWPLSVPFSSSMELSASITSPTSLSNIQVVEFPEYACWLESVQQCCGLPSMRKILATGLRHPRPGGKTNHLRQTSQSNVTSIVLRDCEVGCLKLSDFLRSLTSLEEFYYSRKPYGANPFTQAAPTARSTRPYQPLTLRSALLPSRSSLRNLTILGPADHRPTFIGSLHEFTMLEVVFTEFSALLSFKYEPFHFFNQLCRSLPTSLRKLILHGQPAWNSGTDQPRALNELLKSASSAKTKGKYPFWEAFTFSACPPNWAKMAVRGELELGLRNTRSAAIKVSLRPISTSTESSAEAYQRCCLGQVDV